MEAVSHYAAARDGVDCFRVRPQAAALFENAFEDASCAPHIAQAQMALRHLETEIQIVARMDDGMKEQVAAEEFAVDCANRAAHFLVREHTQLKRIDGADSAISLKYNDGDAIYYPQVIDELPLDIT